MYMYIYIYIYICKCSYVFVYMRIFILLIYSTSYVLFFCSLLLFTCLIMYQIIHLFLHILSIIMIHIYAGHIFDIFNIRE